MKIKTSITTLLFAAAMTFGVIGCEEPMERDFGDDDYEVEKPGGFDVTPERDTFETGELENREMGEEGLMEEDDGVIEDQQDFDIGEGDGR